MRGWMSDSRSYVKPIGIGEVMRSGVVGKVIESKNADFSVGTLVHGYVGWQEYFVSNGSNVQKIILPHPKLRLVDAIASLGSTGLTAYFGMTDIGKPKPGDTVVVSGAAGATGSIAGQIAKMLVGETGKVIGIAGSDDKCKWLIEELGYDVALNYKDPAFGNRLIEETPNFINVYYDNVGGSILDACLNQLATFGRIVLCGAISQYNSVTAAQAAQGVSDAPVAVGPANYMNLIKLRGTMQGFIVTDYKERFPEGFKTLAQWIVEGKLKSKETIIEGIDNAPTALEKLFEGVNTGKMLVKVADE
ncbi:hypothetical protein HK096_009165 [Nowakowskiella sp. JEL0078]|nr:hypothetical protein HK096_009165 [Nowakowskiella sp. JEL0078]